MRILIALLVLVATPAQAASILYLTDHRGVGASYGYWDGPETNFYWEPCAQFAADCVANAGDWSGSVDHDSHLRADSVYANATAAVQERPCDSNACSYATVFGRIAITLTVDEDSPYVYTSVIDGVLAPIQSGVLRAGEVFSVGSELWAESWPDGYIVGVLRRSSSFSFSFSLGSAVPEPGTAAMLALGLAVTAARRRYRLPSQ